MLCFSCHRTLHTRALKSPALPTDPSTLPRSVFVALCGKGRQLCGSHRVLQHLSTSVKDDRAALAPSMAAVMTLMPPEPSPTGTRPRPRWQFKRHCFKNRLPPMRPNANVYRRMAIYHSACLVSLKREIEKLCPYKSKGLSLELHSHSLLRGEQALRTPRELLVLDVTVLVSRLPVARQGNRCEHSSKRKGATHGDTNTPPQGRTRS